MAARRLLKSLTRESRSSMGASQREAILRCELLQVKLEAITSFFGYLIK